MVSALLKNGAAINALDQDGHTPLMSAVFEGHLDVVETLLEAGANVSGSALYYAADAEHRAIVLALVNKGAYTYIDTHDGHGNSALMWAAANGHLAVVDTLLAAGANYSIVSSDHRLTAIQHMLPVEDMAR